MSTPYVQLEKPLSEYALICRGCLAESGEMKNMQEWGLAEDFYRIAEVLKRDGVTELLCTACEENLIRTKRFRQQCQQSDAFLEDTAKKKDDAINIQQANSVTCLLKGDMLTFIITATEGDSKIFLPCPFAANIEALNIPAGDQPSPHHEADWAPTRDQFRSRVLGSCQEKFSKRYHLSKHLIKEHGLSESLNLECQYYCAFSKCSYYVNSGQKKHFNGRKYLNQHYRKVHNSKITCETCRMRFCSADFEKHLRICNIKYLCQICNIEYKNNERLLVHLKRRHPELHKKYKRDRKASRLSETVTECKKMKIDDKLEFICDSPKRSLATQTRAEDNIKNDVTLLSWKSDNEAKTDEISTQTVFEDLLSLKSQTSEDESIFFSETVSLSDIQTQTFPIEFGLSRSNKETITSETQSPDLSIKETQTCFCLLESKSKTFDSFSSSPLNINLTSTETQTPEFRFDLKSEDLFHSTETQTCFDEELGKENL